MPTGSTPLASINSFTDTLRRSSVLRKAGRPVIDVAYHIGETVPAMTGGIDPPRPDDKPGIERFGRPRNPFSPDPERAGCGMLMP